MLTNTINLKIAIIGTGPVSLTLAALLTNHHIPFTIFESSPAFRTTGGSLDLHPESGQRALREAGLWEKFKKHARPESDCLKLVDISGEVLWDENTTDKQDVSGEEQFEGRPEIDRTMLMQILYENLASSSIQFSKKLVEVVPNTTAEKKYDLHFEDRVVEEGFDLVVGGDGAWSKVRTFLTDSKPQYSGISLLELWHMDMNAKPWLEQYVGAGSCFAFGEGCAVQSQRQGDGGLRTYASLRVPEDFLQTCGIDWNDQEKAKKEFVERYMSHIGEDLKRLIFETSDNLIPRTLYELPIGFKWPSRPGVTLVGDAAHVMTPFAGVGVNVGMTDSLVLAKEIIAAYNGEKSLDEALQSYEKEMYPRAEKYMRKTERNKVKHFSAGGAQQMANMLRTHHYGEAAVQK